MDRVPAKFAAILWVIGYLVDHNCKEVPFRETITPSLVTPLYLRALKIAATEVHACPATFRVRALVGIALQCIQEIRNSTHRP